jgi:DNA-binding NarL/FixJ family response regulator
MIRDVDASSRDFVFPSRSVSDGKSRTLIAQYIERLAARSRLDLASRPVASDGASGTDPIRHGIPFRLTAREQDVLERLTLGRTNREIATDLFISEKTASVHVSNIKGKLGANGRAEIAAIAVRLGLVPETTDA